MNNLVVVSNRIARAKSNEPRKLRAGCCQRARTEWCQLGERVAGSMQYIDTKFG